MSSGRSARRIPDTDPSLADASDPFANPSLKGFTADWKRDGSTWDTFRRACPTDAGSRRLVESLRSAEVIAGLQVQGRSSAKPDSAITRRTKAGLGQAYPPTRELTFQRDIDASFDICARPSMHTLHSTFFSDQRAIEHLYPVFSPSKPRGFSDILIPSNHYWQPSSETTYEWELKKGRTSSPTDIDWDAKNSTIYWRGKVTRGADTPPGHGSSFQKQRLVKKVNTITTGVERILVGFDTKTAGLYSVAAPMAEVSKLTTDIAMACDPNLGECSYLRSLGYRVEPPAPLNEAWKHKYVLDLDEIGFSPRFFALMESKSAVIKSSVQLEFWKGWIKPWWVALLFSFFILLMSTSQRTGNTTSPSLPPTRSCTISKPSSVASRQSSPATPPLLLLSSPSLTPFPSFLSTTMERHLMEIRR